MTLWQFIKMLFIIILPIMTVVITSALILNLITENVMLILLLALLIAIAISFFAIKWCKFVFSKDWF